MTFDTEYYHQSQFQIGIGLHVHLEGEEFLKWPVITVVSVVDIICVYALMLV